MQIGLAMSHRRSGTRRGSLAGLIQNAERGKLHGEADGASDGWNKPSRFEIIELQIGGMYGWTLFLSKF